MKKGHPFMIIYNRNDIVDIKKGKTIRIDGQDETIHSVYSVESEPHGRVKVLGFLAKEEERLKVIGTEDEQ